MLPTVSIILPIYNAESYLEECLDSVLAQSFKDFEVICVNDGSSDRCDLILEWYRECDNRVSIITTTNRGPASARNTGFTAAQGSYIYFIDSDDYLHSEALELMTQAIKDYNLDLVSIDAEYIVPDGYSGHHNAPLLKQNYSQTTSGIEYFTTQMCSSEYRVSVWRYLYKAEFLIKNQITFTEIFVGEDKLYSLQCLLAAERIKHISRALYTHRIHTSSLIETREERSLDHFYGSFIAYIETIKILKNYEWTTGDTRKAIRVRLERDRKRALFNHELAGVLDVNTLNYNNDFLAREVLSLFNLLAHSKAELSSTRKNRNQLKGELKRKENTLKRRDIELSRLRNSKSYKLGRIFTSPLRFFRKLFSAK